MPSLHQTASPVLSALRAARTRSAFQSSSSTVLRQIQLRNSSSAGFVSSKIAGKAQADWGVQVKKVGSVAMMYFPVVGVVMFWPYLVEPVMSVVYGYSLVEN